MTLTENTNVALLDAVFAVTAENEKVRVSDPAVNHVSITNWYKLDDARREGKFPHVKFFCVRRMDDPEWKDAPVSLKHSEPLIYTGKGFSNAADAARVAWKMWQGDKTPHGATQGTGGWFYYHNGRTAAQGLKGQYGLEGLCKRRGLVIQGVDGRWYPAVSKL